MTVIAQDDHLTAGAWAACVIMYLNGILAMLAHKHTLVSIWLASVLVYRSVSVTFRGYFLLNSLSYNLGIS